MMRYGSTDAGEGVAGRLRVPTSMVIGVGAWGRRVAQALGASLFSAYPHLQAVVRVVGLSGDGAGMVLLPWSEIPADAEPPDDPEKIWQALADSADELRRRLSDELDDATSPPQDDLLEQGGAARLMGPRGGIQINTVVITNLAEPGAGACACEFALALRQWATTQGDNSSHFQLCIAAIEPALDQSAVGSREAEAAAQARAWLALAEIDETSRLLSAREQLPAGATLLSEPDWPARVSRCPDALFDSILLLDKGPVSGHRLPLEWLLTCACEISRIHILAFQDLATFQGDADGLLQSPAQPYSPRPSVYGSVGVSTLYYPRSELLNYAAGRMAMVALRQAALRKTDEQFPDRQETTLRFLRVWQELGTGLEPTAFVSELKRIVAVDRDGQPVRAPRPWDVATDRGRVSEWVEQIADYELVLLSKLRQTAESIRENGEKLATTLTAMIRDAVDEQLNEAGSGIAFAETLLSGGAEALKRFREDVGRQHKPRPPDTAAARNGLAEAISRLPNTLAGLARAALGGSVIGAFLKGLLQHVLAQPVQVANVGVVMGFALGFAGLAVLWHLRWQAVIQKREDVLAAVHAKAEAAITEMVWQQVEPLLNAAGAAVASEQGLLTRLREALGNVEYAIWSEIVTPQVGDHIAATNLGRLYGPDGAHRREWQGSRVLEDFDVWAQESPEPTTPQWQSDGAFVPIIRPDDFERRTVEETGLYEQKQTADELWQTVIDGTTVYQEWRTRLSNAADDWQDRLSQNVVEFLVTQNGRLSHLREANVDDIAAELDHGALKRVWDEYLYPRSDPFAEPQAEALEYELLPHVKIGIVLSPRIPAGLTGPPTGGEKSAPLIALALDAGFQSFVKSYPELYAFVIRGFAGVPIDALVDLVMLLRGSITKLVREGALDRGTIASRRALWAWALPSSSKE